MDVFMLCSTGNVNPSQWIISSVYNQLLLKMFSGFIFRIMRIVLLWFYYRENSILIRWTKITFYSLSSSLSPRFRWSQYRYISLLYFLCLLPLLFLCFLLLTCFCCPSFHFSQWLILSVSKQPYIVFFFFTVRYFNFFSLRVTASVSECCLARDFFFDVTNIPFCIWISSFSNGCATLSSVCRKPSIFRRFVLVGSMYLRILLCRISQPV